MQNVWRKAQWRVQPLVKLFYLVVGVQTWLLGPSVTVWEATRGPNCHGYITTLHNSVWEKLPWSACMVYCPHQRNANLLGRQAHRLLKYWNLEECPQYRGGLGIFKIEHSNYCWAIDLCHLCMFCRLEWLCSGSYYCCYQVSLQASLPQSQFHIHWINKLSHLKHYCLFLSMNKPEWLYA